jgi:uncharacterized protein YqgV (UPF0045/DUF77 family)
MHAMGTSPEGSTADILAVIGELHADKVAAVERRLAEGDETQS